MATCEAYVVGKLGRYVCGPVNHEVPRTPIHAAMDRDGQRNGCEVDAIILRGEQGSVNRHRRRENTDGQSEEAEIGKRGSEIRHIVPGVSQRINSRRVVFGESWSRKKVALTGSVDAQLLSGDCKTMGK